MSYHDQQSREFKYSAQELQFQTEALRDEMIEALGRLPQFEDTFKKNLPDEHGITRFWDSLKTSDLLGGMIYYFRHPEGFEQIEFVKDSRPRDRFGIPDMKLPLSVRSAFLRLNSNPTRFSERPTTFRYEQGNSNASASRIVEEDNPNVLEYTRRFFDDVTAMPNILSSVAEYFERHSAEREKADKILDNIGLPTGITDLQGAIDLASALVPLSDEEIQAARLSDDELDAVFFLRLDELKEERNRAFDETAFQERWKGFLNLRAK